MDEPSGTHQTKIEDFDILKTIGTGTFARVYLCKHKDNSADGGGKANARSTMGKENNANSNKNYYALKVLSMTDVIRLKQIEHVKSEKNILLEINHPFLVDMIWHYKDSKCLYMLFPYICGGELFSYLRSSGRFSANQALFYTAEIVSAFEYLHSKEIVYRDLKPENLLLAKDGHLKMTDFGFAKRISDTHRTWTLCGTPEYLAPEVIQSKGHSFAVDWWALGILIFEMLSGYPPFFDETPFAIYEKILAGKIDWPRHIDLTAKDLIKRLLVHDQTKRLGMLRNGVDDVKRHRWLKHIEWEDVYHRRLKPPIIPEISHDGDVRNYNDYPDEDKMKDSIKNLISSVSDMEQRLFDDF